MKDDKRLRRKVRNSYIVSTVSIALVLFLLGSVGYLMVAALKVADTLQESIAVTVELKRETTPERRDAIEKRLAAEDLVATIAYVPKEAKLEDKEFRKMFDSAFEEILEENPLLDSFELTLTPASADKELLAEFIAAAERIEGVDRVSYPALTREIGRAARGYAVFVQYGQRAARDVEPSVRGGVKPDARGRERGKEVSLHAPQVELRRLRLPFGRRESLVVLLRQTQAGVEGERFGLGVCAAAEQCREDDGKSFHRSIRILKNMA